MSAYVRFDTLMVGRMNGATKAGLLVDAMDLNAGREVMKGLDSLLQAM